MKNKQSNTVRQTATSVRGSHRFSRNRLVAKLYPGALAWLPQLAAVLAALLKEVFDESAYSRFLKRHRLASSATAYAEFQKENDRLRARRPKCC
jgi:hypothetical protein